MKTAAVLVTTCLLLSGSEAHRGGGGYGYGGYQGGWAWSGNNGWGNGWKTPHPGNSVGGEGAKGTPVETKTLDQLYADALAEGGRAIIYAGGDTPGQQDYYKNLFEARFPNTTLDIVVDYSKYHNARIDNQLATNNLVPDLVQLQTLQDFPRWRDREVLLSYKPRSWDAIPAEFKDPNGFYTGIYILSFSNCVNKQAFKDPSDWPTEAYDLLRGDLKGKITLAYPNDDDATLFLFKQFVDKYGWDYLRKFAAQNPTFVRGTEEPTVAASENRTLVATGVACVMGQDSPLAFVVPKKDPFVTWPQTAAIFRKAKHPATAKLYLNWITEKETQEKYWIQWSIRNDVPPPKGYRGVFEYPGQTDPTAFGKWMADRAAVELFRTQLQLYLGEVKGDPSPGYLGLYPDKALPH